MISKEEMKRARLEIAVNMITENPSLIDKIFNPRAKGEGKVETVDLAVIRSMIEIDPALGQQLKIYTAHGGSRA